MQALHIVLPEVLVSFAGKMNSAATPLILLLLGASFEAQELATYKKELLVCVGLRLVVFPGLILTLSMALGLRDIEFVTLLAMTTAPTAVNSFNMAQPAGRRQSSGRQRRGGVHRVVLLHAVFLDHTVQAAGYVLKQYKIKENAP